MCRAAEWLRVDGERTCRSSVEVELALKNATSAKMATGAVSSTCSVVNSALTLTMATLASTTHTTRSTNTCSSMSTPTMKRTSSEPTLSSASASTPLAANTLRSDDADVSGGSSGVASLTGADGRSYKKEGEGCRGVWRVEEAGEREEAE